MSQRTAQAGRTLVELMVAVVIGLAILIGLVSMYVSSDRAARAGQTLFDGYGVMGCEAGQFRSPATGDFSCVPAVGDALVVRFQADSVASPAQGALRDCLGSEAPTVAHGGPGIGQGTMRPLVTNAYWLGVTRSAYVLKRLRQRAARAAK